MVKRFHLQIMRKNIEFWFRYFIGFVQGPSKNYATARGGGGWLFCHISSRIFEGEGGILWNSYVTADTQFEHSLVSLMRYWIIKSKNIDDILCPYCLKYCSSQKVADILFLIPACFRNKAPQGRLKNPSYKAVWVFCRGLFLIFVERSLVNWQQ